MSNRHESKRQNVTIIHMKLLTYLWIHQKLIGKKVVDLAVPSVDVNKLPEYIKNIGVGYCCLGFHEYTYLQRGGIVGQWMCSFSILLDLFTPATYGLLSLLYGMCRFRGCH